MASDAGFTKKIGANNMNTYMQQLFAASNAIYTNQVHVSLQMGPTDFRTTRSTNAAEQWNEDRTIATCASTNTKLNSFKRWRYDNQRTTASIWHLMTDCYPPPGVVGLAYVDVLANTVNGAGWTNYLGTDTWKVFAHEIGHNYGGPHSFENGQGNTGGIMDYGKGMDDMPYFNKRLRQNDICSAVKKGLSRNGQFPAGNAFTAGMIGAPTPATGPTNKPTPRPTASPPTTNPACANPPADKHANCKMWAATGSTAKAGNMCTSQRAWMNLNCGKSCCDTTNGRNAPVVDNVCGVKYCDKCSEDGLFECEKCAGVLVPAMKNQVCLQKVVAYTYTPGSTFVPKIAFGSGSFLVWNVTLQTPMSSSKIPIFAGVMTNGVKFALKLNQNNEPVFILDDIDQIPSNGAPVAFGETLNVRMSVVGNVLHLDSTGQTDSPLLQWPHDVSFRGAGIESWKIEAKDSSVIKSIEVLSYEKPGVV
jgi:hypothetical protein